MDVSIVIPTFNERDNIRQLIKDIDVSLSDKTHEVIVIDDNSPDGTAEAVMGLQEDSKNLQIIQREGKHGIGSAYKKGFSLANGNVIVQMDADFSHRPGDLHSLIEACDSHDAAIGSRYVSGGERNDPSHRSILPQIGSWLYRTTLGVSIHDITTGFKAYTQESIEKLLDKPLPDGYSFQAASIYTLEQRGADLVEVPIVFQERAGGTSKYSWYELWENLTTYGKLLLHRFTGRKPTYTARR